MVRILNRIVHFAGIRREVGGAHDVVDPDKHHRLMIAYPRSIACLDIAVGEPFGNRAVGIG